MLKGHPSAANITASCDLLVRTAVLACSLALIVLLLQESPVKDLLRMGHQPYLAARGKELQTLSFLSIFPMGRLARTAAF